MADDFGLEEPVEGLGAGTVIRVALGSDRGNDPELLEAFGVANREVLGGFNRSSHHLYREVWDGSFTGMVAAGHGEAVGAVAGASRGRASGGSCGLLG
ncbi:hypothetical protein GCM10023153_10350 [Ornithinibacter aureus]|uniref:Uncharacterized protein n=1 Tax=Ornithinibacter aureus TaxID=622664 RepID=A0ABP8JJS5_9MICO